MKRLFVIMLAFALAGCSGSGSHPLDPVPDPTPEPDPVIAVTSVTVNKTKAYLEQGGTIALQVVIKPNNATDKTVSWKSSNPSFATVSATGLVTAVAEGKAVITATVGGKSATCDITVLGEAKDLSLTDIYGKTTPRNTANCYVVSKPGYYKIPMVYGNAIKNGATNKDAYVSSVSGESILVNFLDHKGNGINTNNESKDPWISQKYAIKSADLVWEDSQDLIKAVSISGTENVKEEKFVKFYLDKEYFTQGNAIIAVFESDGSLAWSWHIWATDADLTPVPVKSQLNTYNFLPVFLGWCEPKSEKSKNGGKYGNCTFYQWGRKDPMLGGTGSGASDKQYYCSDNPINMMWMKDNLQTNISQYIQHPNVFNTNEHMDQKYSNLWSIDAAFAPANFNPTKKTVYDPSPAGFCVPPSAAFTGFTSDGKMGTSLDKINSTEGCKSGEGIYFYTGGWKTGKLIHFPGIGSRNFLGTLSELNVGSCWTATCAENSLLLYYGASSPEYTVVTPYIYSAKANGNAVIPCQE